MSRPSRAPDLVAALEAAVSARVAKRVKDTPALADTWAWTATDAGWEVRADDVVVRIAGPVATVASLSCTCLMAPKCVHLLAVATVLGDGVAEAAVEAPSVGMPSPLPAPSGNAVDVARAHAALATLLRLGAHAADAVVRAELSRAAYDARAAGLHRLGRALVRVVRSLRLLEAGHPTFTLAGLVDDVVEALDVSRRLGVHATPELLGEARRTYSPVGTLRLYGLCSEPVLSGTGHAGVVTWLVDARGREWHVSDVRPRAAGQAAGVYDVAPPLTTTSHRKLGREGLFVQGATAAEGRLGAGGGVSAVRAGGANWDVEPLLELWVDSGVGSGALGSAATAGSTATPSARALRCFTGVVRGLWRDALVVGTDGADILVLAGSDHSSLPWRDNLRMLARCPGLALRFVGRDVPERARAVVGLGVYAGGDLGSSPESAGTPGATGPFAAGTASVREGTAALREGTVSLALPPEWAGRVNLGLDRLTTAHLPRCGPAPMYLSGDVADPGDPLAPLRRRVARALLGGAASLPGDGMSGVSRDVARLRGALLHGGAALLSGMAEAASTPRFSAAWLAAALYLGAADRERGRLGWVG